MGYLYLIISLFSGATKGFFGKKVSGQVSGIRDAARTNLVRMVLCVFISVLLLLTGVEKASLVPDGPAVWIGIAAGVTLSVFTITWLLAVQHGAFMLISIAQMFGVVVTLICSALVFGTRPSPWQYAGVVLLLAAVLVMGSYSKKLKGGISVLAVALLVLCGLSSGLYDFTLKLFTAYSQSSKSMLNLLTYLVSAVILGGMVLTVKPQGEPVQMKKVFLPILLMSVCLFLNSYFKAFSTQYLPDAQLYPTYQAGGLILSAVMAALFFGEKITLRCMIGIVLAFGAILLLR